jgi:hypothetical protein
MEICVYVFKRGFRISRRGATPPGNIYRSRALFAYVSSNAPTHIKAPWSSTPSALHTLASDVAISLPQPALLSLALKKPSLPSSSLLRYELDSMAENIIARRASRHQTAAATLTAMSDIPATISPPSLLMSSTSPPPPTTTTIKAANATSFASPSAAPIIPPPPPLSTRSSIVTPSVISRPTKRHVRPRATTEEEKLVRLEERKLANRTAAKLSRERQKQVMDQALRENERLKQENADLLARLTNLEQRMQAIEQQQEQRLVGVESNADVVPMLVDDEGSLTHQSARQMYPLPPTEPQCPIPSSSPMTTTRQISRLNSMTSSIPRSRVSTLSSAATALTTATTTTPYRLTSLQTRTLIYVLHMLMHSFALSIHFRIPLTRFLSTLPRSSKTTNIDPLILFRPLQHPLLNVNLFPSSPWMTRRQHGYATPSPAFDGLDLGGATRATIGRNLREVVVKNMSTASGMLSRRRRTAGSGIAYYYKDLLRRVKRSPDGSRSRRGDGCIRLIIKKKSGKRMNK